MRTPFLDLHMHSTSSDGTDTPDMILRNALRLGLDIISLTDHDTYQGAQFLQRAVKHHGIGFITGIEFSCKDEQGKYHILGYRFDPSGQAMLDIVEKAHDYRVFKALARINFLKKAFGFVFTSDEMDALMANPNPGKPHIGNLMALKGYAKDKNEAILKYINCYHGKTLYLKPQEAIEAILEGGGIPMLAHPIFGDGGQFLSADELDGRVRRLMDMGLRGLECYYSRNTPEQNEFLVHMAQEKGLLGSAGSDYHGRNKTVRMGDTGLNRTQSLPAPLVRFLEEACPEADTMRCE